MTQKNEAELRAARERAGCDAIAAVLRLPTAPLYQPKPTEPSKDNTQ
jgi:hypothetical protein